MNVMAISLAGMAGWC